MLTIKEGRKYKAVDVRCTPYAGAYQIVEKMSGYLATCGVYPTKKALFEAFHNLELKHATTV